METINFRRLFSGFHHKFGIDKGATREVQRGVIYLDHNATTHLCSEALDAMAVARKSERNPMSLHRPGRRARVSLDQARESVRRLCGAPKADVVFTSGGTEADHLAVRGLARAQRDATGADRVLVAEFEHPAVLEAAESLRREGFKVEPIPANNGLLDIQTLEGLLDSNVALVAVMVAHNTTGIIQPVAEVGRLTARAGVPFHADAVQAAGKVELDFYGIGCTSMALSAHKFGGPRGVGALVLQKCVTLTALWGGGGQEEAKRSGSHPGALIAGMAAAADAVELKTQELLNARELLETVLESVQGVIVLGQGMERLPNTVSVLVEGISGREFVQVMDQRGFALSAGAACHSAGGGQDEIGQVRFSLSSQTLLSEIKLAAATAVEVINELRENQ